MYGGTCPALAIIERRESCWKPDIGIRAVVALDGTWTLAEPVPVRRPGVCATGVDARDVAWRSGSDSGTGSTNMGLKLWAADDQ